MVLAESHRPRHWQAARSPVALKYAVIPPARSPESTNPRACPVGTLNTRKRPAKLVDNASDRCATLPMHENSGAVRGREPYSRQSSAMTNGFPTQTCWKRAPRVLAVFECRSTTKRQLPRVPDSHARTSGPSAAGRAGRQAATLLRLLTRKRQSQATLRPT